MAGTISFGGIASGLDTEGIVTGLVNASRAPVDQLKTRASQLTSATSTLSKIGTLLAKLQSSLEAVDDARELSGYAASSSSSAVTATATGAASAGSFSIDVLSLAKEQRTYSNGYAAADTALGLTGSLNVSVAGASATAIALSSTDTLADVASKINSAGLRVSASVFNDGTSYRLQVTGLDSGAANTITFGGTTLGLNVSGNTRQAASDAHVKIDNFDVTRPTNDVSGIIQGVTLKLSDVTTSSATIRVATDPSALSKQLSTVVDAYNAVIDAVHTAAGFGTQTASEKALAGDSMLRSLESKMFGALGSVVDTGGAYKTLGSVGLSLGRDGKLSLDRSKLDTALGQDPGSVAAVIAGASSGVGAADALRDVVKTFTAAGTGLVATRKASLDDRAKSLNSRISAEEDRLSRYADLLREQFQAMDTSVGVSNNDLSYIQKLWG